MPSSTIRIHNGGSHADAVARGAEALRDGGLLAFPTETVYGVAARADIPAAMKRLRKVKGRDAKKAFTAHIGDPAAVTDFAPDLSALATRLIRKSWPGPLTLIVPVTNPAAAPIASGLAPSAIAAMYYENTIGLRCPANAVARGVLCAAGGPVVAASANLAGRQPPRSGSEVAKHFTDGFDLLIDDGETQYANPSTIVRIDGEGYELLRAGVYDARMVSAMATLRILFVCTGNTCRSPMAAGLARKILADRLGCEMIDIEDRRIVIASAGTAGGWGGASPQAVAVMRNRGIDIAEHESGSFSAASLQSADYIYAMTEDHRAAILRVAPDVADRVSLVMGDKDVADPVGGSEELYERCASQIEQGLRDRLREVCL